MIGCYFGNNPIKSFCKKNKIDQKSVLMSLNLSNCNTCFIPPEQLLKRIRSFNVDIPVYFITDELLTEKEKNIFISKLSINDAHNIIFIADQQTYKYMLSSKGGLPSVCSVSLRGKVLAFNHLKHENLDYFFETITVDFKLALVRKISLRNNTISSKKCQTMIRVNNSYFAYHGGVNLLCKYNYNGENIQDVWIDSLNIDYLKITKELFTTKQQEYSEEYYNTNHPPRNELVSPVNLMRFGKDTLCITATILCLGDTIYSDELLIANGLEKLKGQIVKYQQRHACLLLFDTSLNYLGLKHFYPYSEGAVVNFYCNGASVDSRLYFGRNDINQNRRILAEYVQENSHLVLKKQFVIPQKDEKMIQFSINNTNKSSVSITYPILEVEKLKIVSTSLYKFENDTKKFSKKFDSKIFVCPAMYETPKGNYILLTESGNIFSVRGFDRNKEGSIN